MASESQTSSKTKWDFINNEKVILLTIIIAALIIRISYLIISKGQALWWDEAEYMSAAKHWAFGVPYELNEQRPPLFQLLAAGLLKFGFGESSLKFILVIIPSIALIALSYYLGKEMFNGKIGLFGALGAGFVWSLLFWSVRFQPDFLSLTFQMLALIFFWKLVKAENPRHAIYSGIFAALGFYFKISALLVPLSMLVFTLYYDGLNFIKKKSYWFILLGFIGGLVPFMIWQAINFGNPLAFAPSYSGDFNVGRDLGWVVLDFYYSLPKLTIFILFVMGLFITITNLILSADIMLKNRSLRKDPGAFSLIILFVVALFYIFYIKGTIEDRWVLLIIPFIFFMAAKPLVYLNNKLATQSKTIKAILIIVIIGIFIYPQITHATNLIDLKKSSYMPVKDASLFIKDNSEPSDKILSVSYTQTTAYAEREVITYAKMDIENFTKVLNEKRPKFIIASILEPHHPEWIVQQAQNEQGFRGILFPYFNSTIVISPQNQVVQFDLKKQTSNDLATFTLIYPYDNSFGGLVAYKIDYKI